MDKAPMPIGAMPIACKLEPQMNKRRADTARNNDQKIVYQRSDDAHVMSVLKHEPVFVHVDDTRFMTQVSNEPDHFGFTSFNGIGVNAEPTAPKRRLRRKLEDSLVFVGIAVTDVDASQPNRPHYFTANTSGIGMTWNTGTADIYPGDLLVWYAPPTTDDGKPFVVPQGTPLNKQLAGIRPYRLESATGSLRDVFAVAHAGANGVQLQALHDSWRSDAVSNIESTAVDYMMGVWGHIFGFLRAATQLGLVTVNSVRDIDQALEGATPDADEAGLTALAGLLGVGGGGDPNYPVLSFLQAAMTGEGAGNPGVGVGGGSGDTDVSKALTNGRNEAIPRLAKAVQDAEHSIRRRIIGTATHKSEPGDSLYLQIRNIVGNR